MGKQIEYKGYWIDDKFTYPNFITVQYCGDEVVCQSVAEARSFIDEITEE